MYASKDLSEALALVRHYDADTHAAMVASEWHVTTDVPEFISWFGEHYNESMAYSFAAGYDGSNAFTYKNDLDVKWPVTMVNLANTLSDAMLGGVPLTEFLAATLVHEYRHTVQHGSFASAAKERDAYAHMRQFASKLPHAAELVTMTSMGEETDRRSRWAA